MSILEEVPPEIPYMFHEIEELLKCGYKFAKLSEVTLAKFHRRDFPPRVFVKKQARVPFTDIEEEGVNEKKRKAEEDPKVDA